MKKFLSMILVISVLVANMGFVYADEETGLLHETESLTNNLEDSSLLEEILSEIEEDALEEDQNIDSESEATKIQGDTLDEKVEEYLATFPEDSADKQMFIREIGILKFTDSYTEEEVDKVYDRFKPIDISSLPEIEPVEIPVEDTVPDESSVIRISEEERERNAEENQQLIDWYAEMMEGMSDEEAEELGIDEEIIHLVKLKELREFEEEVNETEAAESKSSKPMKMPKNPSLSANTISKAPMAASGAYHNVYLKGDGTVWTWGSYNTKTIKPTMDTYTVPTRIEMLNDIVEVAAADNYALALSSDGTVYAWGAYTGTGYGSRDPIIVSGVSDIISIAAGNKKSLALKADGTVYEWTTGAFCAKQVMKSANEALTDIKDIAAGDVDNLYAVKTDGSVWAWSYDHAQTGDYPIMVDGVSNAVSIVTGLFITMVLKGDGTIECWYNNPKPEEINLLPGALASVTNVKEIYTGRYYGAMQKSDGSLYFTGSGPVMSNVMPFKGDISNVASIALGMEHFTVVKDNGSIWTKGYNDYYQLGIGNRDSNNDYAEQIYTFSDTKQIDAAWSTSSAVLKSDGTVWTWGSILDFQYGYSSEKSKAIPVQVTDMNDEPLDDVSMIKLGRNSGFAIKDGMVWSWGKNDYGCLGRGTYSPINKAAPVRTNAAGNPYLTDIVFISANDNFAAALDNNGDVWTWGYNNYGQLGIGNTTNQTYAVKVAALSDIKDISAGSTHVIALDKDDNVWTWGRNVKGELGLGNNVNKSSPQKVNTLSNIRSVSAGDQYSTALDVNGDVWTWGYNNKGQLGNSADTDKNIPTKIVLENITQISAGSSHVLAIDSSGDIWSWGDGSYGKLGDKTNLSKNYPVKVLAENGKLDNITSVSAGYNHSLALKNNGSVWGWGAGSNGQLGDGKYKRTDYSSLPFYQQEWILVMNITPKITQVSSKLYHSLVLKSDGTVWASGYNDYGQLGNTTATDENVTTPIQVMGVGDNGYLDNIVDVKAGDDASVALTIDGKVLAWGYNDRGKLGQPLTNAILYTPTYVRGVGGTGELTNIIAIDAGARHTLALSGGGKVYAWGDNTYRQLGDGTGTRRDTPVEVVGLTDVIAISAYGNHSLALKSDGTVWAWGQNDLGQLGTGETSTYEKVPVQVKTNASTHLNNVKKISAGYTHNAVLKSDGTVWTWGHNDFGQLGLNNTTSKYYATQVTSISNADAVFAGACSTYVITDGDVLKAWGQNTDGKVGDNSISNRLTPVDVSTTEKIKTVTGSWNSAAAITTDGTLLMWGTNSNGQFGIGTMENVSKVPVPAYITGVT